MTRSTIRTDRSSGQHIDDRVEADRLEPQTEDRTRRGSASGERGHDRGHDRAPEGYLQDDRNDDNVDDSPVNDSPDASIQDTIVVESAEEDMEDSNQDEDRNEDRNEDVQGVDDKEIDKEEVKEGNGLDVVMDVSPGERRVSNCSKSSKSSKDALSKSSPSKGNGNSITNDVTGSENVVFESCGDIEVCVSWVGGTGGVSGDGMSKNNVASRRKEVVGSLLTEAFGKGSVGSVEDAIEDAASGGSGGSAVLVPEAGGLLGFQV